MRAARVERTVTLFSHFPLGMGCRLKSMASFAADCVQLLLLLVCVSRQLDGLAGRVNVQKWIISNVGVFIEALRIGEHLGPEIHRIGTHQTPHVAAVIPFFEVVEAGFGIAFFAGEVAGADIAAGSGDGLAVAEGLAIDSQTRSVPSESL
jgi:hypothetical protein